MNISFILEHRLSGLRRAIFYILRYGVICVMAIMLPSHSALSLTLKGAVRSADGNNIGGALVTLTAADGLYSETVYSNDAGRFLIESSLTGKLSVRARKPYFADANLKVATDSDVVMTLRALTGAQEISDQLTISAHFAHIKFENLQAQKSFQVDCVSCHQLGNAFTRAARSPEQWTAIVQRMLAFWGVTDEAWIASYVDLLANGFDGKPLVVTQQHHIEPLAQIAKIFEWKLADGVISHDTEFHARDGMLYTVDQGSDRIYITNPLSHSTETFYLPEDELPLGGKFFTLYGNSSPFGLSVRHGPHSLQEGPDGRFYTTDTISAGIGEFDPQTKTFINHDIGGSALYPHTLRFDQQARVWFTVAASNQLGRFDLTSKEMTLLDLPKTTTRQQMPALMPYGIDISPKDGSVWYSRLHANMIGRVDPQTLEIQEFDPGINGPRRLRFSADGMLWIPAFGDGELVRLNPLTMEYKTFPLPKLAANEIEAPYAVGIHPKTQEVWVTATTSDRVFRFFPKQERFINYPLPTKGTYLRDIIFLPDGRVCAASSPVPAIPAVVEGGMQAIVCIDPNDA